MMRRREWRNTGLSSRSLDPVNGHRERALSSARLGADQAGMNAKMADAAGGSGQAIHFADEFRKRRHFRRLATLSATLNSEGLVFKLLMRKRKCRSGDAATPATGSRAHMETSDTRLHSTSRKMLYARVGRCECCKVARLENRYIYQYIRKIALQHSLDGCCCSRRRTIKYPEISSSCLSGGLHG
jgi:hypothetical protein